MPTGCVGDTVRLNDLEPHTWSYYTSSSPIHSLNPIDVRIAYYGKGQRYSSTTATPSGSLTALGAATTDKVQVGYDASENIFVYYKTLERTDGATTGAARASYRTIPNPFSVRPTFTSGGTKYYTGFYRWRVKNAPVGGKVYTAATGGTALSAGSMVEAEQELFFELDENSQWINLELEAVWARAWVVATSGTGATNISLQNVGYERNFIVLNANADFRYGGNNGRRIGNTGYAVTISNYYPDGTAGNANARLTYDITLGANVKFEYTQFNGTDYRLSADGHNLVIGRGCAGTYGNLQGLSYTSNRGGNATLLTTSTSGYSLRVESGSFSNFYITRNENVEFSEVVSMRATLGCDYDRAKNNNSLLTIAPNGYIYGGNGVNKFTNSNNRNNLTYDWCIKSGTFHSSVKLHEEAFYLGNRGNDADGSVSYIGKRRLVMEGGNVGSISGGLNEYGTQYADYIPNDGGWSVYVRVCGANAKIRGVLYGAAVFAGASGDRQYVFTQGSVDGWVAGGCNGTSTTGGQLNGDVGIYVGGQFQIGNSDGGTHVGDNVYNTNNKTYGKNGANGGMLFGAGCGILPTNSSYEPNEDFKLDSYTVGRVDNSLIVIADDATVWRDVYGGGNYGYVNTAGKSEIHILGGTVKGKVFGGSNNQRGQEVSIVQRGGTVVGGVYGGSNSWGTVAGPVKVSIEGGTVGEPTADPSTSETGHVFGSGYGEGTSVAGDVEVVIGSAEGTDTHEESPTIYGNVYGGGHNAAYTQTGHTFTVTAQNGVVKGNVFGGGKGETATIIGDTDVTLRGSVHVMKNVYGGGHLGQVEGSTNVKIK